MDIDGLTFVEYMETLLDPSVGVFRKRDVATGRFHSVRPSCPIRRCGRLNQAVPCSYKMTRTGNTIDGSCETKRKAIEAMQPPTQEFDSGYFIQEAEPDVDEQIASIFQRKYAGISEAVLNARVDITAKAARNPGVEVRRRREKQRRRAKARNRR